jgi:ferredoxin
MKSIKALFLSLPMLLISSMLLIQGQLPQDPLVLISMVFTWLLLNSFFFLMLYTGKTHQYRSALFITIAFCFIISFMANLIAIRGSLMLTKSDVIQAKAPFCHMVIPMTIIPAVFTRTIIFPGSILEGFAAISTMLVLWLGASLAYGRAWCSWTCFFGGLDEFFSRLSSKTRIKKVDHRWTYFPYALLLVIVLLSAATLSPTYCEWLCPFKSVTEFEEITSVKILVQTIIFTSLFLGTVIILPILTRRRVQCGLFCPFGAFQSFTNKINAYEMRIDHEKCRACRLCLEACPTFSLDETSFEKGEPRLSCTRCGKCVDLCPSQAISFHIKCVPDRPDSGKTARIFFLYPAFIFLTAIGGGSIIGALWRIMKLVSTGSMI